MKSGAKPHLQIFLRHQNSRASRSKRQFKSIHVPTLLTCTFIHTFTHTFTHTHTHRRPPIYYSKKPQSIPLSPFLHWRYFGKRSLRSQPPNQTNNHAQPHTHTHNHTHAQPHTHSTLSLFFPHLPHACSIDICEHYQPDACTGYPQSKEPKQHEGLLFPALHPLLSRSQDLY